MAVGVKWRTTNWDKEHASLQADLEKLPGSEFAHAIEGLGLNQATDVQVIGTASADLSAIDVRGWRSDPEFRFALQEAREALQNLARLGYDRWFSA